MTQHLPSLDLILAYRAVMESGSLTGAAKQLNLAQPTVRRQIELLEQQIGTALFTRASNGLTPNDMALSLKPIADSIVAQGAAFKRAASRAAHDTAGIVRVTCARVVATHVLPYVLPPLYAQHPEIQIELVASNAAQDLLRRDADIAIRMTQPTQQALIQQALPDVALGLFAGQSLIDGGHAPRTLTDIRDCPLISGDTDRRIDQGLVDMGAPAPHNITLRTDDDLAQIGAIVAGVGTGLCQIGLGARLGLIRVVPKIETHLPCFVLMHEDQRKIARIRAVFDHLCAKLPAQFGSQTMR